MDAEPYSSPPRTGSVQAAPRRSRAGGAAVAALILAVGAGGYVLGRRSAAAPSAPPPAVVERAPAPAAREFMEVDLDGGRQLPLTPIGQAASHEYVVFKRGIVHLGAAPGSIKAGRPIDLKVDGRPQRVYTMLSPEDSRVEEIVVSAKGRDRPHTVDWGTSESRWDGKKITWTPKN